MIVLVVVSSNNPFSIGAKCSRTRAFLLMTIVDAVSDALYYIMVGMVVGVVVGVMVGVVVG